MKRKILMLDRDNNVVKEFKNIGEAVKATKVPRGTIYHQCHYETPSNGLFYFRYKETSGNSLGRKATEIVELDTKGNFVASYLSQADVARAKGISYQVVNHYLRGRAKPKGFKLMYKKDYLANNTFEKDEVVVVENKIKRPTQKDYYINVLVGVVNGTLVDGAKYDMNGTVLTYSKNNNALMLEDKKVFALEDLWKEVDIELPILPVKEKEFLSNLLKAFSNAKGIVKCKDRRDGYEFIRIETNNPEDNVALPSFIEGKYYKTLKLDTLYTLQDLELN